MLAIHASISGLEQMWTAGPAPRAAGKYRPNQESRSSLQQQRHGRHQLWHDARRSKDQCATANVQVRWPASPPRLGAMKLSGGKQHNGDGNGRCSPRWRRAVPAPPVMPSTWRRQCTPDSTKTCTCRPGFATAQRFARRPTFRNKLLARRLRWRTVLGINQLSDGTAKV
jgi:hypothetical protein